MRRWGLGVAVLLVLGGGIAVAYVLANRPAHRAEATHAATTTRPKPKAKPQPPPRVHGSHNAPVPILMYHVLGVPRAGEPYPELFVKPADFAGQINWLATHGYHAVTLGQVFRYWRRAAPLPVKPVVLTFDDGYLSDYTVAMPTLRKHGWAGVLNLVLKNLRPGDITPNQVRGLIQAGWELDAHTISHADLTTLGPSGLGYEIGGSRAELQQKFDQPVFFFCYPAGRYDARVITAVSAAGFLGATTENPGLARPTRPYTLDRIRISYSDGVRGFAEKMQRYAA